MFLWFSVISGSFTFSGVIGCLWCTCVAGSINPFFRQISHSLPFDLRNDSRHFLHDLDL